MSNAIQTHKNEVDALLAMYGRPFAKALATFVSELMRSRAASSVELDAVAEAGLPASWEELPEEVRKAYEAEIQENLALAAAGKAEVMEFTADGPVVAATNRLRRVVQEKGITQKQLAQTLKVSPSFINRVFQNPDRSKVATLRRIAKALGVDLHAIL